MARVERPGMSVWGYLGVAVGVLVLLNVLIVVFFVVQDHRYGHHDDG